MIPAFFGDSANPLWGVFHPAEGTSLRSTGIVICAPIGAEHQRTYTCLRRLADNLARQGFPVFRFDYLGTGDSSGDLDDASLTQWIEDTRVAIDELCDLGDVRRVALIGLRAGAIPALSAAIGHRRVRHTLLWDPVLVGTTYIERLRLLHCQRHRRWPGRNTTSKTQGTEELMGYRFPRPLITELQQFEARDVLAKLKHAPHIIYSDAEYVESAAPEYQIVPDAGHWYEVSELPNQLTPLKIPRAIQKNLAQEAS